jgi:hypothetical protein
VRAQVDIFLVLSSNHDGGEDVYSVESAPEGAIEALRRIGEGRVVRIPQVEQWATSGAAYGAAYGFKEGAKREANGEANG